jgi:hypothetical protein
LIEKSLKDANVSPQVNDKLPGLKYALTEIKISFGELFRGFESLPNKKFTYPEKDVIEFNNDWMITPEESYREKSLDDAWNGQMPFESSKVNAFLKDQARRILWHNDEYCTLYRENLKIIDHNTEKQFKNMDRMKSLVHSVFEEMSQVVINDASQRRVATAFFAKATASSFNPVVEFANAQDENLQDQFIRDHQRLEDSARPSRKQRT